jgi:hypothetical protein
MDKRPANLSPACDRPTLPVRSRRSVAWSALTTDCPLFLPAITSRPLMGGPSGCGRLFVGGPPMTSEQMRPLALQ